MFPSHIPPNRRASVHREGDVVTPLVVTSKKKDFLVHLKDWLATLLFLGCLAAGAVVADRLGWVDIIPEPGEPFIEGVPDWMGGGSGGGHCTMGWQERHCR